MVARLVLDAVYRRAKCLGYIWYNVQFLMLSIGVPNVKGIYGSTPSS